MLTVPYCTWPEFVSHPTFLDTLDLSAGDALEAHQRAVLTRILLMASTFCDNYCELGEPDGTLTAHSRTENLRMRVDRHGRLLWHPQHIPFISLQSMSYGQTVGSMATITAPQVFPEDSHTVVMDFATGQMSWTGSLQFGSPGPSASLLTSWNYLAGFPNTLLTGAVTQGAVSIPIADATGIVPGQTLKIFDPGADETITVSSNWVPTTGPASLTLASGLLNAHPNYDPVRVSAMGMDIFEACVNYSIALLLRPDATDEDAFPDLRGGASTRLSDSRKDGSGLIWEAQHLLEPLRRVV